MNGFRLSDIISAIKRRYWLVIVSVMIIAPIAGTVAFMLPSKYKATANVLVQDQQIPVNLAGQTVTSTAYERLSRIRQRLLASEQLLRLVDELDVFAGRPDMTPGEKVSHKRRNITIEEVIGGTQRNPKLAAIKVSFTDGAPGRAARIATALVDVILTWPIEDRRGVANGTAEAIADITSTGETLPANHLRILDDGLILKSEATLFRARGPEWDASDRAAYDGLVAKLSGKV